MFSSGLGLEALNVCVAIVFDNKKSLRLLLISSLCLVAVN